MLTRANPTPDPAYDVLFERRGLDAPPVALVEFIVRLPPHVGASRQSVSSQ